MRLLAAALLVAWLFATTQARAGDADEVRRANEHRLAALMAAIHNDDDVVV